MPADRNRPYSPDKVYDIAAQRSRAVQQSQTRAAGHNVQGQPARARMALARGLVTEHQWVTLTHPALVASSAHPEATVTLTHQQERDLISHCLATLPA